eukprot:8100156-Ditylum_brightwellii.AAC.1
MLETKYEPIQQSAVDYFELLSNLTVIDYILDEHATPTPVDIDCFSRSQEEVFSEVQNLKYLIPAMISLADCEQERVAITCVIERVLDNAMVRPFSDEQNFFSMSGDRQIAQPSLFFFLYPMITHKMIHHRCNQANFVNFLTLVDVIAIVGAIAVNILTSSDDGMRINPALATLVLAIKETKIQMETAIPIARVSAT